MIFGERVKQVREMLHLTQSALADLVPTLTQSQLSRIESGKAEADPEVQAMLAATLGVQVTFFDKPPTPGLAALSPQLRARSSRLTEGAKAAAMQWARLIDEEFERLRQVAATIPVALERMDAEHPADAARATRAALGFDPYQPLPYVVLAVERLGVTVLGLPYTSNALDAFCAWKNATPVICLLDGVPGDRRRFSLAHELGHLVLHDAGSKGKEIEDEADEFAAELLAPRASMEQHMPRRPTLSSLTMMKTQWGVSVKSLVRRARELGFVDQDRSISLYKQISARGWNRSEPGSVPIEKPRAFRKLAEIAYGQGPNVEMLARHSGWSQGLTLEVLNQHATADDLPLARTGQAIPLRPDNVVDIRRHHRSGPRQTSGPMWTAPVSDLKGRHSSS